jgi:hypothetical protein
MRCIRPAFVKQRFQPAGGAVEKKGFDASGHESSFTTEAREGTF